MLGRIRKPPVVKPGPNVKPNPKPSPVPPKGADTKPGSPVVKPGPNVGPNPKLPPKLQQAVGNALKGPLPGLKKGGSVDGCAKRGKTKGKMV